MTHKVKNAIKAIHAAGFKAYMRTPNDTWVHFTDGDKIGYAQESSDGFVTLSTVHIPNKNTGTGFRLDDVATLSKDNLALAFMIAPTWATSSDRNSVKKWPSFEAFKASCPFISDCVEVKPIKDQSND